MRFGVRLALTLVVPLVALTGVLGYVYQQRSQAQLRAELAKESRAIALVVQMAAEDYLRDRQIGDLRKLVDGVSGYERVLGLRIFGPEGDMVYQSSSLDSYPFENRALLDRVLRQRRSVEVRQQAGTQSVLGLLFPLVGRGGRLEGAGQILQLESYVAADARANRDFILALTLATALATITIVLVVTRIRVTRPIGELVSSFRQVGGAHLPTRVPVRSDDELGRLAREFNGMCERLEQAQASLGSEQRRRQAAESRLRNAQRLAGLGRLAAGLAHEIGTPLNVISGRAEALKRHLPSDERAERALGAIAEQSDRIVRIVRDMLDFARMKVPCRTPTDVRAVVCAALALSAEERRAANIRTTVALPPELPPVSGDAHQLEQVFQNLVSNACDAMEGGGNLEVEAEEWVGVHPVHPDRGGLPGRYVRIVVTDTGAGIAPEHREHVFDPFFTTKAPGRGMGLGLAVSYGIVEEHGGWLDLHSQPGAGTRVAVHIPVEGGDPEERAPEEDPA